MFIVSCFSRWEFLPLEFWFLVFLQEDVDNMRKLNFDAYRFSISWSRIFPSTIVSSLKFTFLKEKIFNCCIIIWVWMFFFFIDGTGEVNWKGVAYYNRLINYMLQQGNPSHFSHLHKIQINELVDYVLVWLLMSVVLPSLIENNSLIFQA